MERGGCGQGLETVGEAALDHAVAGGKLGQAVFIVVEYVFAPQALGEEA